MRVCVRACVDVHANTYICLPAYAVNVVIMDRPKFHDDHHKYSTGTMVSGWAERALSVCSWYLTFIYERKRQPDFLASDPH